MNTISRLLTVTLLGMAPVAALRAQQGSIGSEHRYQFSLAQVPSTYSEKLMIESFSGLDPEMRVDIDRGERSLKILAYRPLDQQELIRTAASHGVGIQPRNPRLDPDQSVFDNQ